MASHELRRGMRRHGLLFAATALLLPLLGACTAMVGRVDGARQGGLGTGDQPLTFDVVFGPRSVDWGGDYVRGLKWASDGWHYLQRRRGVRSRIDALSGDVEGPAYDADALESALAEHEAFDEADAGHLARHPTVLADDYSLALLRHDDELYVYRFAEGTLASLGELPGDRPLLTLSPDSARVAFVRDNNLYAIDLGTGQAAQLTEDGNEDLLNGMLDWVYQEEVYGRGTWQSYWWSDDGEHIAFLQLDESEVPEHTIVDHLQTHPELEVVHYPKAGDPNPQVRLGIVPAGGGETVWADLSKYGETEILICDAGWSPDGAVVYLVKDRESRWMELNEADAQTGVAKTLLRETSEAWVNHHGLPNWLEDGSFLWFSERDGWKHLYHYTRRGELIRRVTSGLWEVRKLHGIDEEHGCVYFTGTRDSHIEEHAYCVKLDGREMRRLTEPGFTHRVTFDPNFNLFIDTFSSMTTPTKVYLRNSDGDLVRVISENRIPALERYRLTEPEVVRVPTPNGYGLNAIILRPPNMKPHREYPVMLFTYGGPHGPAVHNRWDGRHAMFRQLLAQMGIIVWTVDPHSASGEGAVSAWHCYQQLGVTELADLEESLRWLAQHEHADLSRVGIEGYSYGGFMAAFALTHSTMFKVGLAGAAVTDWRNYDTVYTEMFMRTPQNNPEGYERASVVAAAANLRGHLLLVHGAVDDNVHVQNALQLSHELQQLDKTFDVMIYPDSGHGVHATHFDRLRYEFIRENL